MTTPRATRASSGLAAFAHARGFTLIELMVVVGVIGVLLVLAAPSMQEMIQMRRLRAINAQLVTDIQLARSEAVARRAYGRIAFDLNPALGLACYTVYTAKDSLLPCNCSLGPGQACSNNAPSAQATEIKTVHIRSSTAVTLDIVQLPTQNLPTWTIGFEPAMGSLVDLLRDFDPEPLEGFAVDTKIDDARALRVLLGRSGRPTVCAPPGSRLNLAPCP